MLCQKQTINYAGQHKHKEFGKRQKFGGIDYHFEIPDFKMKKWF